MGMSSQGGPGSAMSDINVTPMVDVMLVLLIIFMVTAPLMNSGVTIDLPRADAPPLSAEDDQLVLSIDASLQHAIDGNVFPAEEVRVKLAAIAKANPDQALFLEADGEVPYRHVARALAAAKQAGFPRVGMVFQYGDEEE